MEGTIIRETSAIKEQARIKIEKEITEYENMAKEGGIACIMPMEERKGLTEFLFGCIDSEDGFAENVVKECKSISNGLMWAARKIPEKMKKLGMVPIDNRTVFEWFAEYFSVDEEKEKAEEEARRKADAEARKANMSEDQKKWEADRERRMAEAEAEAKRKAEEEKRKKMGVMEGQMDLFSMMEPAPVAKAESEPVPAPISVVAPKPSVAVNDAPLVVPVDEVESEEDVVAVDINPDDVLLPFDIDGIFDKTDAEAPGDSEEDTDDAFPWEEV